MATPENEKKTPIFNWETMDFAVDLNGAILTATDEAAVIQLVIKALQTERGIYLIYANLDDPELHHAYGNETSEIMTRADLPEAVRMEEMKRAIREALIYEDYIRDVVDIELVRRPAVKEIVNSDGSTTQTEVDAVYAEFLVLHVFGSTFMEGVNVYNG